MKKNPFPHAMRVGLTGGIASGKSVVAEILQKHWPVIDLDKVGQDLLERDPDLKAQYLRILSGNPQAALDSAQKRALFFAHPERREQIEALLHPAIWKEFQIQCGRLSPEVPLVVCEAALLVEANLHREMDKLCVVYASPILRHERLMTRDHITAQLASQMVQSQRGDTRSYAHYVLPNEGSLQELHQHALALVRKLQKELSQSTERKA